VCATRLELHAKTFDAARELVLLAKWQERHRKGGAKKSHWACPECAKPSAVKSMGPSTGVHWKKDAG
jgi:hypothetical protein